MPQFTLHKSRLKWTSDEQDQWLMTCPQYIACQTQSLYAQDGTLQLHKVTSLQLDSEFVITPGSLPDTITSLTLDSNYNSVIHPLSLPLFLTKLNRGFYFNKPIVPASLPDSLLELTFGFMYNQPISPYVLPRALLSLTFGFEFNHPIHMAGVLPPSLTSLKVGECFTNALLALPQTLVSLEVDNMTQKAVLPPSIKILKVSFLDQLYTMLKSVTGPSMLEHVRLHYIPLSNSSIEKISPSIRIRMLVVRQVSYPTKSLSYLDIALEQLAFVMRAVPCAETYGLVHLYLPDQLRVIARRLDSCTSLYIFKEPYIFDEAIKHIGEIHSSDCRVLFVTTKQHHPSIKKRMSIIVDKLLTFGKRH
ncbi:hypothetical protein SAMD00019534_061940 [Acytostelium subglobosum LB1]|uniref:hypothetical protein n=1 Tax=Acytostelium subglobosum LB1 TaxID=1410327 RepID=UPI0006450E3A|nr:hypothetical protein SAMD00019534_061940 [Acytostelium subglobosum LB1]GAM23019.1 hypothetical protein SAMD00019534_061940 [Acytostelium subglobosum LB1]|eukprot:XP_012754246.1 hypothetical protein SAMD00019534_061940 [Acytostelium subglobosum LB1]